MGNTEFLVNKSRGKSKEINTCYNLYKIWHQDKDIKKSRKKGRGILKKGLIGTL